MSVRGTRVLLIRHATTAKVGKSLSGWLPGIPLDEPGRAQARDLVSRLKNVPLDRIWSSPIERALETAQPLAEERGMEILRNSEFGEINFGNWQGSSLAGLQNNSEFHLFNSFRSCTRPPGGEFMIETQARIVRGLVEITQENTGKHAAGTIAVFSHADAIKCAVMHALGTPIDFHHRLEIEPASVTVLHFFPETVRVIQVNIRGII